MKPTDEITINRCEYDRLIEMEQNYEETFCRYKAEMREVLTENQHYRNLLEAVNQSDAYTKGYHDAIKDVKELIGK